MTIQIYQLRCGSCGHITSSIVEDHAKAYMLDHLLFTHGPQKDDLQTGSPVSDTEAHDAEIS